MRNLLGWTLALIAVFGLVWYVFVYHPEPPSATATYTSSELGLSFEHSTDYNITLHTDGNAEREWQTLTILPKDYAAPTNGEGPPAITISVFDNREGLSLEQWVRSDARSNFKLSADQTLSPTTVDELPALKYQHSGLYEYDAFATSWEGRIYLFEVGWMTKTDVKRAEFQDLVSSVNFIE